MYTNWYCNMHNKNKLVTIFNDTKEYREVLVSSRFPGFTREEYVTTIAPGVTLPIYSVEYSIEGLEEVDISVSNPIPECSNLRCHLSIGIGAEINISSMINKGMCFRLVNICRAF